MKQKIILAITFMMISFSTFTKAQFTVHPMVHAGYVYQNQSFWEVGGRLLFLKHDDVLLRVGAAALMGSANEKFAVMPKVQGEVLFNFKKGVDISHSYYFLGGAEVTDKYIAPKVGLSLFGVIDLAGGYAFSFDKKGVNGKQLKGLNLNFTVNIPLVIFK